MAVDAKFLITRHKRWRPGLWRANLDEIERTYESTMLSWVDPAVLPSFDDVAEVVARRLQELRLD